MKSNILQKVELSYLICLKKDTINRNLSFRLKNTLYVNVLQALINLEEQSTKKSQISI